MFLTDLERKLRSYRAADGTTLKVDTVGGWESRTYDGNGMAGNAGVLWHHTASSMASGLDNPTLNLVTNGRSDLAGPLCNITFTRSGIVRIVAAGQANHAGRGSIGGAYANLGNYYLIGIEMESSGLTDDWTAEQRKYMPHLGAALDLAYSGGGSYYQVAHREYSSEGKIDPSFVNMDQLRSDINKLLSGGKLDNSGSGTAGPSKGTALRLPVEGASITQNFGDNSTQYNSGAGHSGTDFAVARNTAVNATGPGTVLFADWSDNLPKTNWEDRWYLIGGGWAGAAANSGGGIVVVLKHDIAGESFLSVYAHLYRTDLNAGQQVSGGQLIGYSNSTGYSTGDHLHWEIIPLPANWNGTPGGDNVTVSTPGYFGRVNALRFREHFNQVHPVTNGEELELMSQEYDKIMAELREIRKDTSITRGGIFNTFSYTGAKGTEERGVIQLLKAIDRNTWNSKKMVRHLFDLFRLGIPGVTSDGTFGPLLRKMYGRYGKNSKGETEWQSGYPEGELGAQRRTNWNNESKNTYDF